ncbi:LLM class flavin-dependent oxidoreductase [Bacillus cereus group sp. Bc002]|uniref:LLM class flavin-dependent oxidoreductase n=1 Tax=unclassified Bacillus cereus group TaxID=2750818 RepID=UPI0022E68785|nr:MULTISPECIES: LLM class flavin-dependent oxidoreductase [unclassified Bacillus cereus group]MDA2139012.1 LLM class flavin-dependent oxidoreductase [Bacillus cereus group sp. Bc256]MDA2782824.1 LLM class flavin-dependent oxidoreductase [Bacillus cereus group sp. Bc002]
MKFCWNLPVSARDFNTVYDNTIEQAIKAESLKFDQVLISSLQYAPDPWVLATHVASVTNDLRILIAQNTNHMLPTVTEKTLATLNNLSNNRIDLNIITGSSLTELSRDSPALSHENRYKRTEEFVKILKKLREGALSYKGEYYQVTNADIYPKYDNEKSMIFIAGSSQDAMQVSSKYGHVQLIYANTPSKVKEQADYIMKTAASFGRHVKLGIFIDIIARASTDEAWDAAHRMIKRVPKLQKRLNKLFLNNTDSVGHKINQSFQKYNDLCVEKNIWAGLSQVSNAVSLSIVGSYKEVQSTIKYYQECGVDYFLLSGSVKEDEIVHIGENILPFVQ